MASPNLLPLMLADDKSSSFMGPAEVTKGPLRKGPIKPVIAVEASCAPQELFCFISDFLWLSVSTPFLPPFLEEASRLVEKHFQNLPTRRPVLHFFLSALLDLHPSLQFLHLLI
ncbi:hypothetical protein AVEN_232384-1 [Araneus ventricosus]|uniref:Uncharacterized protein n=1 Tax=Araneus ventricosus TaxID=182803 RepID=A0A4Y2CU87_ARAVE|nr:hypothetical protein AVEN_232384-1 [Araneus ventricosus]